MEKTHEMPLRPRPLETDSALDPTEESKAHQVPEPEQHPNMQPAQQKPQLKWNSNSTNKPKAQATRADWVNTLWADISGQLRRFAVISSDLFDGLLLKRDTPTGSLIQRELRRKWQMFGADRNLAQVRVLTPEQSMGELWQLYWTIKRHRDPNGRQFHSQTTIDPINNRSHFELETTPGQIHSAIDFCLPPFIQDYGPGPSEFDPEPEDEFDAVMQGVMKEVDDGRWVEEQPQADKTGGACFL